MNYILIGACIGIIIGVVIDFIVEKVIFRMKKHGSLQLNHGKLENLTIDVPWDEIHKHKYLVIRIVNNTTHIKKDES